MALKDIVIARKGIPESNPAFQVRGLSYADLSRLVIDHKGDILEIVNIIKTSNAENMGALAFEVAQTFPSVMASLIALAADEPGEAESVLTLPLTIQTEALMAIGDLTFTEPGAFPKLIASLKGLIQRGSVILPTVTL